MEEIAHDNSRISDEQLARLFRYADEGKDFASALDAAGLSGISDAERDEVRTLWRIHATLSADARAAGAFSRAAGEAILGKIKEEILEKVEELPEKHTDKASSPESAGSIMSPWNALLAANWKFAVPLAVFVIALTAILGASMKNGVPPPLPAGSAPSTESLMEAPPTMMLMMSAPTEEASDAATIPMSARSMATSSADAATDEATSTPAHDTPGNPDAGGDPMFEPIGIPLEEHP